MKNFIVDSGKLTYIFHQCQWDVSDSQEQMEARLNNIRDEVMDILDLSPEAASELAKAEGRNDAILKNGRTGDCSSEM